MCGIVGMAGNLNINTNKMFNNLLIFDQVRGSHSTGVAVVGAVGNDVVIEKDIGAPSNLWEMNKTQLFDNRGILNGYPRAVIGHNRSATVGKITVENSHPFQFGHITGVHNGSLTHYRDLEGHMEHEVDSQAIFDTISKKGIDHCWSSFYGAACLVWWDAGDGTINIIRNDERPMCIAYSENDSAIFWASEEWMLIVSAMRNGVKLRKNEAGKVVIAVPEPGSLYKYKPTNMTCPLMEVRELKKKSSTYTPTTGGVPTTYGQAWEKDKWKNNSHFKPQGKVDKDYYQSWGEQPWGLTHSWAQGWDRAEKNVKGKLFKLSGLIRTTTAGRRGFYLFGETEDSCRVEVYPYNEEEYGDWTLKVASLANRDLWFKINNRPRVRLSKIAGVKEMYRISSQHINLDKSVEKSNVVPFTHVNLPRSELLYKSRTGHVTAARWHEIMGDKNINHACTACDNPISIEMHKELVWVNDKCVLCKTCGEDQAVLEFVSSYHQ